MKVEWSLVQGPSHFNPSETGSTPMTDDLVKRLRDLVNDDDTEMLAWDAADRIEKLEHDLLVVLGMLSERLPAAEKCEMAYEYLLARAALGEKKDG